MFFLFSVAKSSFGPIRFVFHERSPILIQAIWNHWQEEREPILSQWFLSGLLKCKTKVWEELSQKLDRINGSLDRGTHFREPSWMVFYMLSLFAQRFRFRGREPQVFVSWLTAHSPDYGRARCLVWWPLAYLNKRGMIPRIENNQWLLPALFLVGLAERRGYGINHFLMQDCFKLHVKRLFQRCTDLSTEVQASTNKTLCIVMAFVLVVFYHRVIIKGLMMLQYFQKYLLFWKFEGDETNNYFISDQCKEMGF